MSSRRSNLTRLVSALAVASLALSACSSASGSSTPGSSSGSDSSVAGSAAGSSAPALSGTLKVDAAASLKKTFDKLSAEFEKEHPGVKVIASYDGSAVLATQLIGGAPVDVFASADDKNMTKVTDQKLITSKPVEFATNRLQIAVAPGNPKKITGLQSLTASDLAVDLCAVAQPCGAAARTALAAAGVSVKPVSQESSVTAVLTKVESGDADAGLVYRTDVLGAGGKVTGLDFPEAAKAVNHYPIAALDAAPNAAAAKAFIALVTGAQGRKVLASAGFGAPGA
ncbi:molybdate transport system substrate-binding protein [Nakamurella panacisegetis]|uniref:Molybdate transport system substrate-binding protein n=1 Tax=Nakamurella panacisegetis TaxID=1090615 RepID=A0A1H0J541_9ACTN|nr:molybdate ABC transporter substrate-binding protein [Nakamurella panacisegetis]SDO38847.1 molybdate transport system substrate-binding protein [Nakamurella panacisegetis]